MRNKLLLLFILCFLFPLFNVVKAQEWHLEACIDYAIKHNPDIKQVKFNTQKTKITFDAAKYHYFPSLNANIKTGNFSGLYIDPTTNLLDFGNNYINNIRIQSELSLFGGFYNKYYKNIKENELNFNKSLEDLHIRNLKLEIAYLFCMQAFNMASKTAIEKRKSVLKNKIIFVQRAVEEGLIHKRDMLFLEYVLAQDEADYAMAQANEQQFNALLKQKMGWSFDKELVINYVNLNAHIDSLQQLDINKIMPLVKDIFPHLKMGALLSENAALSLQLEKAALYPNLSLQGALNTNTSSRNLKANTSTQFINNRQHYIGLNLSIPIFNAYNIRTNIALAHIELDAAQNQANKLVLDLEQDVHNAVIYYNSFLNNYKATYIKYSVALEAYQYGQRLSELGEIGINEFTDIATRFITSENELLNAKFKLIAQILQIESYCGCSIDMHKF